MRRLIRYGNLGAPLGEVSPNDVMALIRRESINGEHSLEITTTQVLGKNERIVYKDGRGVWREYVVTGIDELHESGRTVLGTYYCVWSLQPDMMGVTVSKMPGVQDEVSAGTALDAIISEQARWSRGDVSQLTTGGASMYDMSGWDALGVLIGTWGGELDTTIEVSSIGGVTARKVNLHDRLGNASPTRRFDFGADMMSVKRKIADEPFYCRISPRGKGEETEGGGYGRKIRITEVNDGNDYLEYAPMVDIAKLPVSGGYQYPTLIVENGDMETPADLKAWAQGILEDTLTPKVTYDVDVVQAAAEGVSVQGVSLGDVVDVVDRHFSEDGLRVQGRITSITVDELNDADVKVTIGYLGRSFADGLAQLQDAAMKAYQEVQELSANLSAATYIKSLLSRINAEINATGGYTYITEGQGLRTYDVAVSDPLVGAEASQVVELKGGSIRIANSRTSSGDWDWKTVFQSGFIAATLINAVNVTAGRIASADGSSYWNLDTGDLKMSGDFTMTRSRNTETAGASLGTITVSSSTDVLQSGTYLGFEIKNGDGFSTFIIPRKRSSSGYSSQGSVVASYKSLALIGRADSAERQSNITLGESYDRWRSYSNDKGFEFRMYPGQYDYDHYTGKIHLVARQSAYSSSIMEINPPTSASSYDGSFSFSGSIRASGDLSCSGTKHRLVATEDYGDRLLYCYETASPMFGDIGSSRLDSDGECIVSIDDVFAETARTDNAYQVFLQPCGSGELFVSRKEPGYFIVSGTPGLAFDWEVKAKQAGYETQRLGDHYFENIIGMQENQQTIAGKAEAALGGIEDYIAELEESHYEAA